MCADGEGNRNFSKHELMPQENDRLGTIHDSLRIALAKDIHGQQGNGLSV